MKQTVKPLQKQNTKTT